MRLGVKLGNLVAMYCRARESPNPEPPLLSAKNAANDNCSS